MRLNIPPDIRAEIVVNYLNGAKKELSFLGNHKRNAYKDILSISHDADAVKIELSILGLYDILPEALFHPIDRFDNIPANEYKERFEEEVEQQYSEEANARSFFSLYDKFIFNLSSIVAQVKDNEFNDNSILSDIICDSLPDKYKCNRFVRRAREYTPRCQSIRGNTVLLTLMLRKVMSDEGLRLIQNTSLIDFEDENPRYDCQIGQCDDSSELYLGNCYEENVICFDVQYWNDDFCDDSFLEFVEEVKVFEDFINAYFMGLETVMRFNLSAQALPVRLSDELYFNYLNYNTNI